MPMSSENSKKFMVLLEQHIINTNRALKNIKSDILADYIEDDNRSFTIVTNKVALVLNLDTIEKYIKNVNVVKYDKVMIVRLSLYLRNPLYN